MRQGIRALWRAGMVVAVVAGGAPTAASAAAPSEMTQPSASVAAQSPAPAPPQPPASTASAALTIEEFQPQGTVTGVEVVQLRFTAPAAAFGDPASTAPVEIECDGPAPDGQGRWLDDRRWIYSFDQAVPAGVSCTARANAEFRSLNAQSLSADIEYAFDTGAPSVVEYRPFPGMDIDEEQVFILRFNAAVSAEEVAAHSGCIVEGVGERIPMEAVPTEHREALMEASYMATPEDPETVALLRCARVLPPEAQVRLEVGPGVKALAQAPGLAGSETPHVLEYEVRPPFLAKMSCTRERAGSPCLPIAPITLSFTAPVPRDALEGLSLRTGESAFKADGDHDDNLVSYLTYPGPFPAGATLTLSLPHALTDDAGRPLANADRYPLEVPIADYPPLAKFASGTFGVIERFAYASPRSDEAQAAAVPVTLRHVESEPDVRVVERSSGEVANVRTIDDVEVLRWYARLQRLDSGTWSEGQLADIRADRAPRDDYSTDIPRRDVRSISVLKDEPSAQRLTLTAPPPGEARPFEVVGIPLSEPGFHILEIESPRLGASLLEDRGPMYVRTGVLLTNLSVHLKQGRDDLLVWVTTLADAESVNNADVAVLDCSGHVLAQGRTNDEGVWHHRAPIDAPDYCADTGLSGLFVSARISAEHPLAYGSADYAFVLSGWDRGIETWRFNVPTATDAEPELLTHTVLDRSLFRAGERVSMKHFLRVESRDGLRLPEGSRSRPDRLAVEHQGSSQRHEFPVVWQETPSGGLAALNTFEIPESAQLGTYSVRLTDKDQGWYGSTTFKVEEFRLPILTGKLTVKGGERPDIVIDPARISVDMQMAWLSGGPAGGQKITLSGVAEDRGVGFEAFDDYTFSAPPFELGGEGRAVTLHEIEEGDGVRRRLFLDSQEFTLDAQGTATVDITDLPQSGRPQRFILEAAFADPNGEIQTLSSTVNVWPSAVQAGLKAEGWQRANTAIPVSLLALGTDAQPQAGVRMQLLALERKTYTVRKRMVGGFYRYDSQTERGDATVICEGVTDAAGTLACTAQFDRGGSFELVAVAHDQQGRASHAYSTVWVSGADELWFGGHDDDRIDLIPAKRSWAAGEPAEFQVRMPFRAAVALVSVEREGVLWSQQVQLSGTDPTITIPIDPDWGPNAYVSVLVLRGRLYPVTWRSFADWGWRDPAGWLQAYNENPEDRLVTSRIDLAKPAFRFGLTEIRVEGQADQLTVELTPEREVYPIRETVSAKVKVTLPDGKPAAHATVALAVVDDALLELAPNETWSLYDAMHPRRSLGVRTATTQMEVVGRRHYGRKAVAAGGGGGTLPTRQLFDTLLSWQPMVQLDEHGEAQLEFQLNDSLSRFTLVAMADFGAAYFGSTSATVVTRQDIQVVTGLPPVVREGDDYEAVVTVRNGTDEARTLQVAAAFASKGAEKRLPEQVVELAAGQSAAVSWRVTVPSLNWPEESATLEWHFEARDTSVSDRLRMTQRIEPALPSTTVQAAMFSLEAGQTHVLPVTAPAGAVRDTKGRPYGGLVFDVSASLAGGLKGVRDWWEAYPYTCLEQTASQAIALADPDRWRAVVDRLATHMDDDGLLRYFPGTGPGSEVLTAYIVSVSDEAQQLGVSAEIPPDMLERMLTGLQAFVEGRIKRAQILADTTLDSRRMMALEALSRHGRVTGTMLSGFTQEPHQWPTPTVVDWMSSVLRLPAHEAPTGALAQGRSILVARMSASGSLLAFSDVALNASPGLMATRTTSLARLMLTVMERPEWQADLPRMARGLVEAQSAGAWAITTENLLAQLALRRFSEQFEREPAVGTTVVVAASDADKLTLTVPSVGEVAQDRLEWPAQSSEVHSRHDGQGHVWVALRAQAKVPLTEPHNAGYGVQRRVVPVQQREAGVWTRGDIYRVELEVHARDGANWVVLNDPIPAGAVILGSGLGRDAQAHVSMPAQTEGRADFYPPTFVERAASGYRAYFEYLPAGRISIAYTVRLNAVGQFALPPTRVEALYRPDLYGMAPNTEGIAIRAEQSDAAAQ